LLLRGRRGKSLREEGKGRGREGNQSINQSRKGVGKRKGREGRGRTTLHTPCRKFLATPLRSGYQRAALSRIGVYEKTFIA